MSLFWKHTRFCAILTSIFVCFVLSSSAFAQTERKEALRLSLQNSNQIQSWSLRPLPSAILAKSYAFSFSSSLPDWESSIKSNPSNFNLDLASWDLNLQAELLQNDTNRSLLPQLNTHTFTPITAQANVGLSYQWSSSIALNAGLDYSYAQFFGGSQFELPHEFRTVTPSLGVSKSFGDRTSLDLDLRYFNSNIDQNTSYTHSNWNVQTQFLIKF